MCRPVPIVVVVAALLLGGCGSDSVEAEASSTSSAPASIVTSTTTSTVADSSTLTTTTQAATSTVRTEPIPIEDVPPLDPLDAEQHPWIEDLHQAVRDLVDDANALGAAAASLDDYSEGWEDQEPFGTILLAIDNDLVRMKESITSVMEANGATLSNNCRWTFASTEGEDSDEVLAALRTMWAAPCPLQVLAIADLFGQRSRQESIDYWNSEQGPRHTIEKITESLATAMDAI